MLNFKDDLPDIYLIDTDTIGFKIREYCAVTLGYIPSIFKIIILI